MTKQPQPVPVQDPPSIGRQAAAGVMWLTIQKWAVRITGFVTIAVLTRFLSPEDFGTVAAASTVLPFFYLLADLGFAAYIVQADKPDRRMLSTGFWFSLVAGILLTVVLVLSAPLVGLVFRSDQIVPVMQVLALAVVFTATASVPMALLRREMRFRVIAVQASIAAVAAQVVAIAMTVTGFGVWALVGQTLTALLLTAVLAWVAARWRPSFVFSGSEFVMMARFGSKVLAVEFVAMVRAWAEAAIISGTLGLAALGYLNIAQRLVQIVQDLTGAALVPVSTVAFAKIRDSADRLRSAYVRALRMTYAALSPVLVVVAVAAPLIIPIIFGDGWEQSAQVAQVLALAGLMVVSAALDHGLFYGLGKPGQWLVYAVIIDLCTVAATAITVQWGLHAVAYGFLVVAIFATAGRWFLVAKLLRASPRTLAGPFGFLAAAVLASGGAGWLALVLSPGLPPILRIALMGIAVLVVHLAVVRLLARQVLDELTGYLPRFRRATRHRIPSPSKERS
ncbi:lipopolysaccharide biosynthesis protein [Salinibacterium sp. ZJ450]|uniref:lipopolysaccharide biosynthesis protein n=1 Tax=Salinibacterium sp. ZJ450 TaxID=2708338 RepID=UPI001CD24CA7|nr:lipopolysaccharide biosynthesis protein [Salinibacterium sp. ZJ450]